VKPVKIKKLYIQKFTNLVKVYFDSGEEIKLDLQTALKKELKSGMDLDIKTITQLLQLSLNTKIRQQLIKSIAIRPRSISEAKTILQKNYNKYSIIFSASFIENNLDKNNSTLINEIIDNLKKDKYLNDQEFAKWWVEQRMISKPRGKKMLSFELRKKGIPLGIISSTLADENILSKKQNNTLIDKSIEKIYKSISSRNYDKKKMHQVLLRRLLGRGFSWDDIKSKIDEKLEREYN
jgi:regulatory protein